MPYFLASFTLSSVGRDFMYPFQLGHQLACHRHTDESPNGPKHLSRPRPRPILLSDFA